MTRQLGQTDIRIEPLVLGTNTAGWTADEATSFATFDAFVDEGFTAFDTADVYSHWVPGNDSESERIIGRWLKARGNRDRVHIFTKVGSDLGDNKKGLGAKWIERAVEDSLTRLQTDYIDLYQSHWPDRTVGQEETLTAYDRLIKAGKVRWIGCSNYDEPLLAEALKIADDKGLPRYQSVQNQFNLYNRDEYEGGVQDIVVGNGLSLMPYYSLAAGFLTGKYRTKEDLAKSARGEGIGEKFLNEKGLRILAAMDAVSEATGAPLSEIALAWINAQAGVVGALASASSVQQLKGLARGARLKLDGRHLAALSDA